MKQIFKNSPLIVALLIMFTLFSCEEETDTPKLCLAPTCGTIDPDATNLTLLIQNYDNIGNIGIIVDEQDSTLSLDGRDLDNGQPFTCWQTVPAILSSSSVVLAYELGEEVIIGAFNVSGISSNALVIEINGDAAAISDYTECNDTPSN